MKRQQFLTITILIQMVKICQSLKNWISAHAYRRNKISFFLYLSLRCTVEYVHLNILYCASEQQLQSKLIPSYAFLENTQLDLVDLNASLRETYLFSFKINLSIVFDVNTKIFIIIRPNSNDCYIQTLVYVAINLLFICAC